MELFVSPFSRVIDMELFDDMVKPQTLSITLNEALQGIGSHNKIKYQEMVRNFKLLQFHSDYRPPYWGTFSKKSMLIRARKPYTQDPTVLDYDYDSEAEWEDEESGEELNSEDDGEEEESEDSEEEDGWLVPHGYLSDDEGLELEKVKKAEADKPDGEVVVKEKKKVVELQPVIYGINYESGPSIFEAMSIQFLLGIIISWN
jgi:hypothetical protein